MKRSIDLMAADNIRLLSAAMVEKAKSGHPGGAMGGADFIHILYSEFLEFDPSDPEWINRDRFFLDPGHMSPMLYSILSLYNLFSMEDLKEFRQWGSKTPGHPEKDFKHGIENTSGPLGQGHTMAVGAAIAERFLAARFGEWMSHKTYTYISDGGIQEEISQGAGRIAGFLGLSNLVMFFDSNDIQLSTETDDVTSEDTAKKYEAWGWSVITIDGHNADEIRKALKQAKEETEKPTLIIGKTIIGKGAVGFEGESFENLTSTHGQPLSKAGVSIDDTFVKLGGDPKNPFIIFDEVKELYAKRTEELKELARKKKEKQKEWEEKNPELAKKWDKFFSEKAPDFDFSKVEQKDNIATRNASSAILSAMADEIENMVVSSADLSNSDKTDGFLKKTTAFKKNDFSGAFLQAGVSELTMACIMNGMALHGGIIPVCGTFFVFSDYMKPAIRLSALMELQVIYVWTHDAFRVGEDGPTHQPVEHEAQIRLLEKLQNHSKKNSMLVLRPSDNYETSVAWKMAVENVDTPTGLIFSRQNINNLPAKENRYQEALEAEKGGYIVMDDLDSKPDVVLLASGSEVATLIDGKKLLEERDNLKVQVVSMPSEGVFRNQPKEYQEKVLPKGVKRFGLTAGLPINLAGLMESGDVVWGLDSFGFSAPYNILDEKLGFNGENVYQQVKELLK